MGRHLDERVEAQIYLKDKNEGASVWDSLHESDKDEQIPQVSKGFSPTVNSKSLHYTTQAVA